MKMNNIDIVGDFTTRLDQISTEFGVKIETNFRALNKSRFFDLKKTDEIEKLQIELNVLKPSDSQNKLYESVLRNKKFGLKKFDKLDKQITDLLDWFAKHSNLNKYFFYQKKNESLYGIIVNFSF